MMLIIIIFIIPNIFTISGNNIFWINSRIRRIRNVNSYHWSIMNLHYLQKHDIINTRTQLVKKESKTERLSGRGHIKETDNRNAAAISENCYQPQLNTWNWMEQRKLRKRQQSKPVFSQLRCRVVSKCQLIYNALWWFICFLRWHERLTKLLILFCGVN
jgi:hypothetical protein